MKNNKVTSGSQNDSKELALHYMKTLVEVAREAFLILNADLEVIVANQVFYQTFRVSSSQTENKFLYDLGNKQWDIPEFRSLLERILPEKKVVKNYEATHIFESIGKKTMLLNASQIDSVQLIILAIEDVSHKKILEEKLTDYTKELEVKVVNRTAELELRVKELERINKMMIGREIKMIQLKTEIKKLKKPRKSL